MDDQNPNRFSIDGLIARVAAWLFDKFPRTVRSAPLFIQFLLVILCTFVCSVSMMVISPDVWGLLVPPEAAELRIGIPKEYLTLFAWVFYGSFSLLIILVLIFSGGDASERSNPIESVDDK